MNTNPGALGRKVGMTQLVAENGVVTPCTVIDLACTVVGKRTEEKDGYTALIVGIGERKGTRTSKPLAGQYKESEISPKQVLREFRCSAEVADAQKVGELLNLDEVFTQGQFVDVRGVSRGRGFSGVMRRHNFAGAKESHGAHEVMRHGGSIGTNMTPGRVFPGRKMAGQHGNKPVSVLNQKVAKIIADKGLVLVRGGIPGPAGSVVEVRGAVKKKNGGRPAS